MGRGYYEVDVVTHAVDHMDLEVKEELQSNYQGHLRARNRDWMSQSRGLDELLIEAMKAERSVLNTRNIVSSRTTQIMLSVPGYAGVPRQPAPVNQSVAERTLGANRPGSFVWEPGSRVCFGCGQQHSWMVKTR